MKLLAIEDFASTGSGGTPTRGNSAFYEGGTIPWVKSGELKQSEIFQTGEHITSLGLKRSSAKIVSENAVLIALYGATVGQCSILKTEAATNQAVCFVIPNEEICLHRYLYYGLVSKRSELLGKRAGGGQPNISQGTIRKTKIPVPELSAQEKIVEILDQADALRRKRREADALHARILPVLFQRMFGDPAVRISERNCSIGDVLLTSQYGTSTKANGGESDIPVVRMNNLTVDGRLDLEDLKYIPSEKAELGKYRLDSGDVLFNRTNSKELVGKTALWKGEKDKDAVFASYLIRLKLDLEQCLPEFFLAYMNSQFMKDFLFQRCRSAIGMANINATELATFPLFLPPISLQREFRELAKNRQKLLPKISESQDYLETLFQTLLTRAFDGRLVSGSSAESRNAQSEMREILEEAEIQAKT